MPYEKFDRWHRSPYGRANIDMSVILADGEWHAWTGIVPKVTAEHNLAEKTIRNLLYTYVKNGDLELKGRFTKAADTRTVRLSEKWQLWMRQQRERGVTAIYQGSPRQPDRDPNPVECGGYDETAD